MREIKFRAWDKEAKTMCLQPTLFKNDDGTVSAFGSQQASPDWNNPLPLMQYAGLKDKNGVEIYEGDVVIHDGERKTVDFAYGGFCFHGESTFMAVTSGPAEVIGNIYQHASLLEE